MKPIPPVINTRIGRLLAHEKVRLPETSIKFRPGMAAEWHLTLRKFEASARSRLKSKAQSLRNIGYSEFREKLLCLERPKVVVIQAEDILVLTPIQILERPVNNSRLWEVGLQLPQETE